MEIKGIFKPEMAVSNTGRSYYVVVNMGSKQINDDTYELVSTSLLLRTEPTYDVLVSALIRKKYDADKMEAIINNYLADTNDETAKAEFADMQAYRQEVKDFCKAVFTAIEEANKQEEPEMEEPYIDVPPVEQE
jgi:hypothetical protein